MTINKKIQIFLNMQNLQYITWLMSDNNIPLFNVFKNKEYFLVKNNKDNTIGIIVYYTREESCGFSLGFPGFFDDISKLIASVKNKEMIKALNNYKFNKDLENELE